MATKFFYLGPWVKRLAADHPVPELQDRVDADFWGPPGDYWPPAGASISHLDLRSKSEQGQPGLGVFGIHRQLVGAEANDYIFLGDDDALLGTVTTGKKNSIKNALGIGEPIVGNEFAAIVHEVTSLHGSPDWAARWRMFVPNAQGQVKLNLGGIDIWQSGWNGIDGDAYGTAVKEYWWQHYREIIDVLTDEEVGRQLGFLARKYGVPGETFIPPGSRAVPVLPPLTQLIDDFNTADSSTTGNQYSPWSEFEGSSENLSNQWFNEAGGQVSTRVTTTLSGGDMEVQVDAWNDGVQGGGGPCYNINSAETDFYWLELLKVGGSAVDTMTIHKRNTTTGNTQVGQSTSLGLGESDNAMGHNSSGSHTGYYDSSDPPTTSRVTGSNSDLTTAFAGIAANHSGARRGGWTKWRAEDLAAGAAALREERSYPRGIARGLVRGVA